MGAIWVSFEAGESWQQSNLDSLWQVWRFYRKKNNRAHGYLCDIKFWTRPCRNSRCRRERPARALIRDDSSKSAGFDDISKTAIFEKIYNRHVECPNETYLYCLIVEVVGRTLGLKWIYRCFSPIKGKVWQGPLRHLFFFHNSFYSIPTLQNLQKKQVAQWTLALKWIYRCFWPINGKVWQGPLRHLFFFHNSFHSIPTLQNLQKKEVAQWTLGLKWIYKCFWPIKGKV